MNVNGHPLFNAGYADLLPRREAPGTAGTDLKSSLGFTMEMDLRIFCFRIFTSWRIQRKQNIFVDQQFWGGVTVTL